MAKHSVSASALIPAPAPRVYGLIADYRNGHPRILPKPYFVSLDVEQGGYGEGTVIDFKMKIMGQIQSFHSRVTEPEPGRVLVETDMNSGTETTFTVEPRSQDSQSLLTITTTLNVPEGLIGRLQGWLTSRLLQPIYEKELEQLASVAGEQNV